MYYPVGVWAMRYILVAMCYRIGVIRGGSWILSGGSWIMRTLFLN